MISFQLIWPHVFPLKMYTLLIHLSKARHKARSETRVHSNDYFMSTVEVSAFIHM